MDKSFSDSWDDHLEVQARRYHMLFAVLIALVLPFWSILDYFMVNNLFANLLILRLVCSLICLLGAYLVYKNYVESSYLGHLLTIVLFDILGICLGFLGENQLPYWTVNYSACFITAALFQTWETRNHFIHLGFTAVAVLSSMAVFSEYSPIILFSKGFTITLSAIVGSTGLFLARMSFMKKSFQLTQSYMKEKSHRMKEQALANTQKEKLRVLNSVSAGVAHEFKNTLNVVSVGALSVRAKIKKNELNQALEQVDAIEKACIISAKLINSMRGSLKVSDEIKKVNLKDLVETIFILNKGLVIEGFFLRNLITDGTQIETNEAIIYGVITNLVQNSIHASDKVRRKEITINCDSSITELKINVSDWGIGVSEDIADKVFREFSSKVDGQGIGLRVSRQQIRDLGGDIILSNLKNPTIFTIILR